MNKRQQDMSKNGTPYAADLSEYCEAGFDCRGVGIDVDAQITHEANRQQKYCLYGQLRSG